MNTFTSHLEKKLVKHYLTRYVTVLTTFIHIIDMNTSMPILQLKNFVKIVNKV